MSRLRAALHRQLDPAAGPPDRLSATNRVVVALILLSVAVAVLETEPALGPEVQDALLRVQLALGLVFVVEYLARLWVCVERPDYARPALGRLRYATSWRSLIDLVAILPVFVGLVGGESYVLRLARVLRILRLARLGRFSAALQALGAAIAARRFELVATLVGAAALMLVSSTLLYLVEAGRQPEAFGSIPRAMWWSVATLTTVGYGDVTPVTAIGRVLAGFTALIGIGVIAMPTGILAAAVSDALQAQREARKKAGPDA